jgi:hypothetical protein
LPLTRRRLTPRRARAEDARDASASAQHAATASEIANVVRRRILKDSLAGLANDDASYITEEVRG